MTEMEFLDKKERDAADTLQRALLGGDGTDSPVELVERATLAHPLPAVGVAVAVGAVLGALAGKSPELLRHPLPRRAGSTLWRAAMGARIFL